MIFEDSKVYGALVKMLHKGWNIVCPCSKNGIRTFLIEKKNGSSIMLTRFIALQYNNLAATEYNGFNVKFYEDDRATQNFLDCRRYNIYWPGFSISNRTDIEYSIRTGPVHETEKFILITFKDAKSPVPHVVPYEPELDEMLRTPKYCNFMPGDNKRGNMSVHGGDARCNLARFVIIYRDYFWKYRGTDDAVERFIKDFASLKKAIPENIDADHLNCNKYINTFENLILTPEETNTDKRNYVNWFVKKYRVHPVLNTSGEIIFAFTHPDLITHAPEKKYYKCRTHYDFVDWINLHQGRDSLTEKLQVVRSAMGNVLTPAGMIVSGEVNPNIAKNNLASLEDHIKWRDELLSLPEDAFIIHKAREEQDAESTIKLICELFGDYIARDES